MENAFGLHRDTFGHERSEADTADAASSHPFLPAVDHAGWMGVALALARSMQGRVWPNPPVGCVIVRENDMVGAGFTQFGGRPHAERVALDQAGTRARGADLYVTLEPCCHWGKTPPCTEAIVAAGVRTVYAAIQDPDPRVNGGGFARLRESGIRVDVGLGAHEARAIMAGFFHRIATGRPLIRIGASVGVMTTIPLIPDGFDGLLRSGDGARMTLLTRSPGGDVAQEDAGDGASPGDVLDALGRRGLTSVSMAEDDPLAAAFTRAARD